MYISALGCNSIKQNIFKKNNNNLNNYPKINNNRNNITSDTFCRSKASKIAFQAGIHFDKKVCELIVPNNALIDIKPRFESLKGALQEISISTTDNLKLAGWFLPPANSNMPTATIFGGTGSNRTHWQQTLKTFQDLGFGAVVGDYRGFGGNHGIPNEQKLYEDAFAQLEFATKEIGIPDDKIFIWAHSMGGALGIKAVKTAEESGRRIKTVLDSTFTNGNKIKKHFLDCGRAKVEEIPPDVLAAFLSKLEKTEGHIEFNNESRIGKIRSPLLFMHNDGDGVIDHKMTKELYDLNKSDYAIMHIAHSPRKSDLVHFDRSWAIEPILKFVGNSNN